MVIRLRSLDDADLDHLFGWERDPRATAMAAFTRPDPTSRAGFDAHYRRVRSDPATTVRAIEDDEGLAGTVSSFSVEGARELTYWIDPARWRRGIATEAVRLFLQVETQRPLHARAAEHNHGSARVLRRNGFRRVGAATAWAAGVGAHVVEHLYELP